MIPEGLHREPWSTIARHPLPEGVPQSVAFRTLVAAIALDEGATEADADRIARDVLLQVARRPRDAETLTEHATITTDHLGGLVGPGLIDPRAYGPGQGYVGVRSIPGTPETINRRGVRVVQARPARIRVVIGPAGGPIETSDPEQLRHAAAVILEAAAILESQQRPSDAGGSTDGS